MIIQVSIKSLTTLLKRHEELLEEREKHLRGIRGRDKELTRAINECNRLANENKHLENEKSNIGKEGTDEIYKLMEEKNWLEKAKGQLSDRLRHRETQNVELHAQIRNRNEEITRLEVQCNELDRENKRLAAGVCEKEEEIDRLKNQLKIKEDWPTAVKFAKPPRKNQTINRPPRHQDGVMHTHGDGQMRKDRFQREAADKTDSRAVLD